MRRLGHAGIAVGTLTPGTTGRMRLEGMLGEKAIDSLAVALLLLLGPDDEEIEDREDQGELDA